MCVAFKSMGQARRTPSALIIALALTLALPFQSAEAADPRSADLVVDANTGAVLHSKAADEPVYPASLTKMMTLYLTFELIEQGRLSYDSKIKMTEEGAAAAPSKLELDPGEELTVLDAIKALVTKSANDVAIALAQHIAGTEENFARLMTKKAREIGMTNTTFRNASGLPDPEQTTTARDMVTLGLRLQDDFPRHYRLFATRTFTYAGKTFRNHNGLLMRYHGTDGIKTGYTRASGFNLVTSVHRDGKHLVAAVFGGDTAGERNARMQSLLNSAFPKAVRVAEARPAPLPKPAAPASAPAPVAEHESAIAVAKVHTVRLGGDTPAHTPRPDVPPSPAQPQFAIASVGDTPREPVRASAPAAFPRFVPETGALQPSTLQAQAEHLERAHGVPAPQPVSAPAARPAPAPRTTARGGFDIQIGAYGDSAEAERHMSAARQRAGGMLDSYRALAMPVKSGSGKLYRARFSGFDATAANETCSRLKSLQIDCFVVRTE